MTLSLSSATEAREPHDLWTLALHHPQIDADDLAAALEREADRVPHDFRTRALMAEAFRALKAAWGEKKLDDWIRLSPAGERIAALAEDHVEPEMFSLLRRRMMAAIRPETVEQFFRELGLALREAAEISVGGSIALAFTAGLMRHTSTS